MPPPGKIIISEIIILTSSGLTSILSLSFNEAWWLCTIVDVLNEEAMWMELSV